MEHTTIFHVSDFLEHQKPKLLSIDSGFESVNLFGGFPIGAVTIVAGYPGMGVTPFMISSMINISKGNQPCLYFSLKNSAFEIMRKAVSNFLQRNNLAPNQSTEEDFRDVVKKSSFASLPLHFCDNSNITVTDLKFILVTEELKKMAILETDTVATPVIFIDDLGSIRSREPQNTNDKLNMVCSDLASLARKLKVAIIVGHSLDKKNISEERPTLALLRQEAETEQPCAKVLLLHHPEYFGIMETEDDLPTAGLMEVIVAKNNSGLTGTIEMKYIGKYHRVENVVLKHHLNPFDL